MARGSRVQFDVVVLGGGSAGIAAAGAARSMGASVCIIELGLLGGECPNIACVPTKAMIRAAALYDEMRRVAPQMGIRYTNLQFSFRHMMVRKDEVIALVTGEGKRLAAWAKKEGITVIAEEASFVDAHTVRAGKNIVKGKSFVLATGATDVPPPVSGLTETPYVTYRDIIRLRTLPDRIAIIGGGPVGVEYATIFSLLRRRVSLFEVGESILPREDGEIRVLAAAALREHGAQVCESTKVLSVKRRGKTVLLTFQQGASIRKHIRVDMLLVATGKKPNIAALNLSAAGVAIDDHGHLVLDTFHRTTAAHIFAAGDVTAEWLLTHTAHADGQTVGLLAAGATDMPKPKGTRVVPRVTFAEPEIASVGITEEEARRQKKKIVIAKFPISALSRAVIDDKRDGIIKIIVDAKTRKILGGHMIGERSGEVIHEVALAMHAGISFETLTGMLHAFPTYSEAIAASADYLT